MIKILGKLRKLPPGSNTRVHRDLAKKYIMPKTTVYSPDK